MSQLNAPPDISGLGASWQLVGATGNPEAGKGGEERRRASLTLPPTSSGNVNHHRLWQLGSRQIGPLIFEAKFAGKGGGEEERGGGMT